MKTNTKTLFALSALALICSSASADTRWTGNVDGTWENAGNWSAGLPSSGNTFIEGSGNPDVTLSTAKSSGNRILVDQGRTLFIANGGLLTGAGSTAVVGDNSLGNVVIQNGGTWTRGVTDTRFGTSSITVQDGGTLNLGAFSAEGSGGLIISGSSTTATVASIVNSGGNATMTLNDSATLGVTGDLNWGGASAISVGAESTVNVGGLMTYGGAFSITSDTVLANGVYNLFGINGTEGGDFATVVLSGAGYSGEALSLSSDVWTATVGGQDYSFSQITGNLTVVPEPGTYALIGGMLALGYVMVRRRR